MSGKKRHYSDFLEEPVGETLDVHGIEFIHESEVKRDPILDFELPESDVHIEIKQFYSDRIIKQLQSKQNVIVLQGRKAVDFFNKHFKP